MLKNHFKIAWRNLLKNRVYSLINLSGLAIGLAAVMLIVLYVKDELSFDRFHENGDRIFRIVHDARNPDGTEGGGGNTGGVEGPAFLKEIPEVQDFCRIQGGGETLVKKGKEALSEPFIFADANLFRMFSFPLIAGNEETALKNISSAVISEAVAKRFFNSTDVIGKTLELNQEGKFSPYIITGVVKNTPVNSSLQLNIVLSIEKPLQQEWTQIWLNTFLNTFVRLKPGADPVRAEKKAAAVLEEHAGANLAEFRKKFGKDIYYRYRLQPLTKLHTDSYYNVSSGLSSGSNITYSYILGSIALFILVIACINFVNLTLARSFRRGKEIGIRKVSGSTRKQLIVQFLSESFLLNLSASVAALILVQLVLPVFTELTNKQVSVSYLFTAENLVLFSGLLFLNTLLSGFYPALVLSGFRPVQVLYGKMRISGRNYLGKTLMVVQFTIAVFLIVGMVVMEKQFGLLTGKNPGYQTGGIIDVVLPTDQKIDVATMRAQLLQYPAIKQVGSQSISMTDFNNTGIVADKKELFDVAFFKMDEQMLPMLQVPFVAGRNFTGTPADSSGVIINQSLARISGWRDPIGKKITWNDHEFTVIGMVKDFNATTLREKMSPLFIHRVPAWRDGHLMVKIDPAKTAEAVQIIQRVFKQQIPFYPCRYTFLDSLLREQYDGERRWKAMISVAAALSVFISCLGLFGLATLSIEQRTKEIGIRKVLGADVALIVRTLSAGFIRLIILSIIIASPVAWYFANRWLQDFAYRIEVGWWVFALAGGITLLISFLTVSTQAVKAAVQNPVKSLKSE